MIAPSNGREVDLFPPDTIAQAAMNYALAAMIQFEETTGITWPDEAPERPKVVPMPTPPKEPGTPQ
jgi:hypothetical protein